MLGITGFAAYGIALTAGERTVDPGTASLIINTVPLWVALLGLLIAGERINHLLDKAGPDHERQEASLPAD